MAKIQSNIKEVKKAIRALKKEQLEKSRKLCKAIGADAQMNIKDNIAIRPAGVFPGYAMRGRLRRAVVATGPKRISSSWQMIVEVARRGPVKKYALIHEKGGIIRAKRKPYLHFKVQGQWVRVKQVRIKAKAYFSKGVEKTRRFWSKSKIKQFLARS